MKLLMILSLVAMVSARPQDEDHYDSKYDNFDIDSVLSNDKIIQSFIMCYRDAGPCTTDAAYFKSKLPETIATECAKCSEKQKTYIAKSVKAGIDKLPEDFEAIFQMYSGADKEADRKRLQDFMNKYA